VTFTQQFLVNEPSIIRKLGSVSCASWIARLLMMIDALNTRMKNINTLLYLAGFLLLFSARTALPVPSLTHHIDGLSTVTGALSSDMRFDREVVMV